ncbi:MAG: NUDIX domain-containing protein [Nanoarchaeota archaeon]|nr:NUDIX domain-containing protein [Nanoarchaeota archaeon]MBU1004378.1 NUDIX domain-containing protein [Nanoarchaeota archaeon]MBU1946735.1 NUDIX domain-containing protein [Nanoarchaeota archaeon]
MSSTEPFDVVDDEDKIVGDTTRWEAHQNGIIHRSVMFFIFNKKGKLFLNQRSSNKPFNPGAYSIVLGGHVTKGDSYEETVVREAEEEAGITAKPYFIANFKSRFKERDKENVALYYFVIDQELKLDKYEIGSGRFVDIDDVKDELGKHSFIPETETIYKLLMENRDKIIRKID